MKSTQKNTKKQDNFNNFNIGKYLTTLRTHHNAVVSHQPNDDNFEDWTHYEENEENDSGKIAKKNQREITDFKTRLTQEQVNDPEWGKFLRDTGSVMRTSQDDIDTVYSWWKENQNNKKKKERLKIPEWQKFVKDSGPIMQNTTPEEIDKVFSWWSNRKKKTQRANVPDTKKKTQRANVPDSKWRGGRKSRKLKKTHKRRTK